MNSDPEKIISNPESNNSNPHFPTKAIAVSLDLLGVISMAA